MRASHLSPLSASSLLVLAQDLFLVGAAAAAAAFTDVVGTATAAVFVVVVVIFVVVVALAVFGIVIIVVIVVIFVVVVAAAAAASVILLVRRRVGEHQAHNLTRVVAHAQVLGHGAAQLAKRHAVEEGLLQVEEEALAVRRRDVSS